MACTVAKPWKIVLQADIWYDHRFPPQVTFKQKILLILFFFEMENGARSDAHNLCSLLNINVWQKPLQESYKPKPPKQDHRA
jgi:hypothetical protein